MRFPHIQLGDTVWTNYNGILNKHTVTYRTDYWFTLDNKLTISGVYSWKNLAIFYLYYWRFKRCIKGAFKTKKPPRMSIQRRQNVNRKRLTK